VETLRDGGIEDKVNARRFLDIINNQTQHLEQLVKDLLELSAIESKEAKMQFEVQDIMPAIENALLMHKKAIAASELKVIVKASSNLPKTSVDRRRIEQVFINLIDNAVKFTPAGGSINIQATTDQSFVRIDVTDTGMGIASEHLNRVFERFYRIDKARSRSSGGSGLGLSIVKHIVSAHQGHIEVSSMVDKGSTFSVFLPLIKA
jgi:two-component system, OmpR family, phosphate regulon sensor histidine kinase PhoR